MDSFYLLLSLFSHFHPYKLSILVLFNLFFHSADLSVWCLKTWAKRLHHKSCISSWTDLYRLCRYAEMPTYSMVEWCSNCEWKKNSSSILCTPFNCRLNFELFLLRSFSAFFLLELFPFFSSNCSLSLIFFSRFHASSWEEFQLHIKKIKFIFLQ